MTDTLVIFDVDGTLVDSAALLLAAQERTCAIHGFAHPGREKGLSVVGLSLAEALRVLVGVPCDPEALAETYKDQFGDLRQMPELMDATYPGIDDLIADFAAHPGIRLGIATGKSRRGVAHLLERNGWDRIFDVIRTADDCPSKPHPAMILEAMAETGAMPERTIMVGDANFDMIMAREARCHALGVAWGFQSVETLRATGAHAIADSTDAIRTFVGKVLADERAA